MLFRSLAKAKAKAARIKCANNLKQVGLAFKVFANDNDDRFPYRVANFGQLTGANYIFNGNPVPNTTTAANQRVWAHMYAMSNELGSAKILTCPGDRNKLNNQRSDFGNTTGTGGGYGEPVGNADPTAAGWQNYGQNGKDNCTSI